MKTSSWKRFPPLVIALACATNLFAYTFLTYRWSAEKAASGIVMHLQLGSSGGTLHDGSTSWGQVAEYALGTWNSHLNASRFKFLVVRDSTIPVASGDGKNSVLFAPTLFGQSLGANTLAVAYTLNYSGINSESDVVFNTNKSWNSYRGPQWGNGIFDFRRIALHEFGHVLGLGHPDQAGQSVHALMNSTAGNLDILVADDIAGGQAMWGRSGATTDDHGNTMATATLIDSNSTRNGNIGTAGDVDYFRINLASPGSLRVESTGSTDTFGQLLDVSGNVIIRDDDSGRDSNFMIASELNPGTYYIRVSGFSTTTVGAYQIVSAFNPSGGVTDDHGNSRATATLIEPIGMQSGKLEIPGDIDYFQMIITTSGSLRVECVGSTDTFGHLLDASGNVLASDDDNGTDYNFLVLYDMQPGTYYVRVSGYNNASVGPYSLFSRFTPAGEKADDHGDLRATATLVAPDSSTAGNIEFPDDWDVFRIDVPYSGILKVECTGATDTYGLLALSTGEIIAQDDDSGNNLNFLIARKVSPGVYYVRVTGYSSRDVGSYQFVSTFFPQSKPVFNYTELVSRFREARVGQWVDFTITAQYQPTKFSITGLPPGIRLNATTGRIYGRVTAAKTIRGEVMPYVLQITARNAYGTSDTMRISWLVQPLFPEVIGNFHGLVSFHPINRQLGGTLKLTIASTSAFGGKLTLGGLSYSLKGALNLADLNENPQALIGIARKRPLSPLVIVFSIDSATGKLTGNVSSSESGQADLLAWRNPWTAASSATPLAASYNAVFMPQVEAEGPKGYGYMTVQVSHSGIARWSGKLADGASITASTGLGPAGQMAFHHPLYNRTGSVQGWLGISDSNNHLDGTAAWFKATQPEKSDTRRYKEGFDDTNLNVIGAPYFAPTAAVLNLPTTAPLNGKMTLACEESQASAEHLFTITANNLVVPNIPNENAMKLILSPRTGVFWGSVRFDDEDPTDHVEPIGLVRRSANYSGLLVTRSDFNQGAGFYMVAELPFLEQIPGSDPPRERRVTRTPEWSGSAVLSEPVN